MLRLNFFGITLLAVHQFQFFFIFVTRNDLHTNLSIFFHHILIVLLSYLRKLVIWK